MSNSTRSIHLPAQGGERPLGGAMRNRPAYAAGPSRCVAPDLQRVWDVQSDPSYDIACDRPAPLLVALRTHAGSGVVVLKDGRPLPLPSGSLIVMEQPKLRRYRCAGAFWSFWWFEFTLSEPFPAALNTPFHLPNRPEDGLVFEDLFVKLQHPSAADRQVASASFALLLHRWLAELRLRRAPSPHQRVVEGVIDRIHGDLSAGWTLPRLAAEAGLCETLFRREFKRVTGEPPARFILKARLHAAVQLIQQGVYTLAGIAEQLHFSSAFHLSAAFKKEFGVSPSQWL